MDLSFYEKIVDGWERTETVNGVPYFVNHKTECTSWDHPYWLKTLEGLKEHDSVRYAAYRTALKVQQIQKQLHLHKVELCTIRNAFEDLGHIAGTWESIHCDDLLNLLIGVYRGCHGNQTYTEEPEMLADITLNLLLNLFDPNKTGFLKVMSVKISLVSLCAAKLPEKYRFFYQELHDPSTYISPRALHTFLTALMQIPALLHESTAFGRTSEPAVASCTQMGQEYGGITEDVFYRWLQQEPQTIVWLHTFHRIVSTETVKHDVKCKICKASPIVGLRYRCLKCFNFDLCQTCFFTGKTKKRHKTRHPMQEYCLNVTAKENTAAFVKTLKNNLSRRHSYKSRLKYLPVEADCQYTNQAWSPGKDSMDGDSSRCVSGTGQPEPCVDTSANGSVTPVVQRKTPDYVTGLEKLANLSPKEDGLQKEREELNGIIRQLEEENRALFEQLCLLQEGGEIETSIDPDVNGLTQSRDSPTTLDTTCVKRVPKISVKEPLPSEATPIYLSVPIIQVNGHVTGSLSVASRAPVITSASPVSAFHPPRYSSPVSAPRGSSHLPEYRYPPPLSHTWTSPRSTMDRSPPPPGHTWSPPGVSMDRSPPRFSLPSPARSQSEFQAEEAELEALVNKAGSMFPTHLSYTGDPECRVSGDENEMLQAASSVGVAMSQLVNKAVNIQLPE